MRIGAQCQLFRVTQAVVVGVLGRSDVVSGVVGVRLTAVNAAVVVGILRTIFDAAVIGVGGVGDGAVVCVSTRAALQPFSGAAGYISSKAAVTAFVAALAVEYRDDGIRANAILPSVIDTPGNRASQPDADYSKWVAPADIAKVILFLCSDASAPTSGAAVPVYGRA